MLFDYLVAILAQKTAFLDFVEIWSFWQKSKFFENSSPKSGAYVSVHYMVARAVARALRARIGRSKNLDFEGFLETLGRGRGFRARNRAPAHMVRANEFS